MSSTIILETDDVRHHLVRTKQITNLGNLSLPVGEYLVKYQREDSGDYHHGILKVHTPDVAQLAGSFTFDIPDYIILNYVEIK